MTEWQDRTIEQRNLLNPAFCAVVLWLVGQGYEAEAQTVPDAVPGLPLELAFVAASFVLRGQTRRQLPGTVRTSLATWVQDHPLERSAVAKGVGLLRPYVREALLFGAQHGALFVSGRRIVSRPDAAERVSSYVKKSSVDVRDCAAQARFVGRWLHKGGTPATVMAMLGVQA